MNPVPPAKLRHVFKHAANFGVTPRWNPVNAALFEAALHHHVNDPTMTVIVGTYRGIIHVTHYFDPTTGRNVMVDMAGELQSAWRLSPRQVFHLRTSGNVQ